MINFKTFILKEDNNFKVNVDVYDRVDNSIKITIFKNNVIGSRYEYFIDGDVESWYNKLRKYKNGNNIIKKLEMLSRVRGFIKIC